MRETRLMLIGAHVSAGPGLTAALGKGASIGADAVQFFTQSPRTWRPQRYPDEILASYREAQRAHPSVRETYCHASYLINLATSDLDLLERSAACLVENARVATAAGASGLILHVGSHKGAGLSARLDQVTAVLEQVLSGGGCPLLLENTAGGGGSVGRDFEELSLMIEQVGAGPELLGICLDTQHLWASGVSYATLDDAQAVISDLGSRIGLERLRCIHLNDSKAPMGSKRDRHENLGEGLIGMRALGLLVGHPSLQQTTAILEVPGQGQGPRAEDVLAARSLHRDGALRWAQLAGPAAGSVAPT
jgi:deoxyribonuclease-4